MARERPIAARNYEPDPVDIQIGAMVIFHRAALLDHSAIVRDQLIQISNDSIWYGQLLAEQNARTPPWDAGSNNEVTQPELFLDAAALVGHVQSILEAEQGRFGPTPKMARSLAVVEVIQHPDKRWQILHAEVRADHRHQGIATALKRYLKRRSVPLVAYRKMPTGFG
jgi:ribosomal protein S18 acetylase RimI-like enzyme